MDKYRVRVASIQHEARGILSMRLISAEADLALPSGMSGAHIDMILANDIRRSYSLYRPSHDGVYDIAVQLESTGKGGSRYIHEKVREGDELTISGPKNNFHVREGANGNILVAGGIGITPIYAILQNLLHEKTDVRVLYCQKCRKSSVPSRNNRTAALRDINRSAVSRRIR